MTDEQAVAGTTGGAAGGPAASPIDASAASHERPLHQHLFALLLLAGMAAVLFAPAMIKGEVFTFRDHTDYFQPMRWFTATELREGRLPLWNPYSAAGEPWLANPQTGVFYAPAWLFLVLPFPTAYMTYLLLHVILLGWGAYLLFTRDVSREAAMVGAAALMFSGPALSMLDVSNNLATFAWIPLVLLAARLQAPLAGGLFLALAFLAGEPFFAAVAALLFALTSRRLRTIAIAAATAIGMSAIQLLPFVEMIARSDRAAGLDANQILRDSMPVRQWLRIAVPPPLDTFDQTLAQHFIPVVYMGVLVVALALVGVVVAAKGRRPLLAWCVLLAVAVGVAAGPRFLVDVPLTLFRYPARLIALGALAVAALTAVGWNSFRPQRKRWVDLLLVLTLAADLLLHARPLLQSAAFATHIPHDANVGTDSTFLRIGNFDGNRRGWMSGYLNLYERRFDTYTAAPVVAADYQTLYARLLEKPTPFFLRALSVRHILASRELQPPFELRDRSGNVRVYEYPSATALANAWMDVQPSPSAADALRSLLNGASQWPVSGLPSDYTATGLKPGRRGLKSALPLESDAAVPARTVFTTTRATVTVETTAPSVVVLTQRDAPGWSVTRNGVAVEKLQAGGLFRAVAVPSGRHEIIWTYQPRALFFGALMTLVTLLAVALRIFVKRSRRSFFSALRVR